VRNNSPSPSASPAPQAPTSPIVAQSSNPSQIRAQEEFLRSMLRAQDPQQQDQAPEQQMPEDPMMKLLSSLAGGEGNMDPNNPAGLPFSPEDIQAATGMPSWATSMLLGGAGKVPPTAEEQKTAKMWNAIHLLFSFVAGMYLLFIVRDATTKFGKDPPPPPSVKNPFFIFLLGELFIHGSRILLKDPSSTKRGYGSFQIMKDIARDGSILVFMLGAASWWKGL
jgi:GET complex subunit GET2